MTIIYGQCNKATKTKINLRGTYKMDCQDGNLIELLKQVNTLCFRSNDKGLSFRPYKQVVSMKLMNNYSDNKPHDPHGFKEEVKIKYDAVKAVAGKFPNGTAMRMVLLKVKTIAFTWANYCAMPLQTDSYGKRETTN